MKNILLTVSVLAAAISTATAVHADTPLVVQRKIIEQPTAVLPANTEVLLVMNETITTKSKRFREGDTFEMSVVNDVTLGEYVVIPKGSRAIGWISWLTSKAVFGKSGKMEIKIEYVEVGGKRVPLIGRHRQDGKGNTVATVGMIGMFGVSGGLFITGKSSAILTGTQLLARTKEDLPVTFSDPMPLTNVSMSAVSAAP